MKTLFILFIILGLSFAGAAVYEIIFLCLHKIHGKYLLGGILFSVFGFTLSITAFVVGFFVTSEETLNEADASTVTYSFYCVSCGNGLTPDMSFCPKCGNEIKSTS